MCLVWEGRGRSSFFRLSVCLCSGAWPKPVSEVRNGVVPAPEAVTFAITAALLLSAGSVSIGPEDVVTHSLSHPSGHCLSNLLLSHDPLQMSFNVLQTPCLTFTNTVSSDDGAANRTQAPGCSQPEETHSSKPIACLPCASANSAWVPFLSSSFRDLRPTPAMAVIMLSLTGCRFWY